MDAHSGSSLKRSQNKRLIEMLWIIELLESTSLLELSADYSKMLIVK